jgi:predicted ABC-type ATPase
MSTPNKINLMKQAKAKGYEVHLVYVTTQDPIINISGVKDRHIKGGHDVPEDRRNK